MLLPNPGYPSAREDPREQSEKKRVAALMCIKECKEGIPDPSTEGQRMQEALELLEDSIRLFPNNHRARFLIVSLLMTQDKFERAKKEGLVIYESLSQAQKEAMGDAALHLSLAHASKMLGEAEDAFKYAMEASDFFPLDPHPHMILGELHESRGEPADAERQCRDALRLQSDPACKQLLREQSVYYTLCCLSASLTKQERYAEAERFLAQAYEMDPCSTLALRHLVDVYHFQGQIQDALELASKISEHEHDSDDANIRDKIAILKAAVEEPRRAGDPGRVPAIDLSKVLLARRNNSRHGSQCGSGSQRSSRRSTASRALNGKPKLEDDIVSFNQLTVESTGKEKKENGDFMCCCFGRDDSKVSVKDRGSPSR